MTCTTEIPMPLIIRTYSDDNSVRDGETSIPRFGNPVRSRSIIDRFERGYATTVAVES